MKKIVFLGCENSHSAMFLDYLQSSEKYKDTQVIGVYSHEEAAAKNLAEKYGVPVMNSYDEAAGIADGVVITARHGDNHYKYAKPYIAKGATMFIDKPITISEEEAVKFMRECKENGVKITGGSSLRLDSWIGELAKDAASESGGKTLGGFIRCPININNPNGGFFFYAQHLIECVQTVFGRYPKSVRAVWCGKTAQVLFRYEDFAVAGTFVKDNYTYYAARLSENEVKGKEYIVDGNNPCFKAGWDEFYDILCGAEQKTTYKDFIAPVFVMNAVYRALESGNEELVKEYEV